MHTRASKFQWKSRISSESWQKHVWRRSSLPRVCWGKLRLLGKGYYATRHCDVTEIGVSQAPDCDVTRTRGNIVVTSQWLLLSDINLGPILRRVYELIVLWRNCDIIITQKHVLLAQKWFSYTRRVTCYVFEHVRYLQFSGSEYNLDYGVNSYLCCVVSCESAYWNFIFRGNVRKIDSYEVQIDWYSDCSWYLSF